ncbi:hypothetical protein FA15DRAFT_673982 [Coprinopsis marcescibilis]|uniref:Thioesterase/thiol ester dehydrase-isomerase n=1 Tax=Coprinopsis marcescibilis TaxID=230819 RepID=A0A5C3KJ71_COPMA|nr:hypothetical protein FA15DRAFT_673982 [Coprinopsis marcescibilis]
MIILRQQARFVGSYLTRGASRGIWKRGQLQRTRTFGSYSTPEYESSLAAARARLVEAGFDPASVWEQRIVWGDQDPFQHVNNVRYARFFESARIKWMLSLGEEWGGPKKAEAMIRGKGVSLILQDLNIQFRRPVTYPDTLLFGYCPVPPSPGLELSPKFKVLATCYSLGLQDFAAFSKETLVWYDYDALKKCRPPKEAADIVFSRARDIDLMTLRKD